MIDVGRSPGPRVDFYGPGQMRLRGSFRWPPAKVMERPKDNCYVSHEASPLLRWGDDIERIRVKKILFHDRPHSTVRSEVDGEISLGMAGTHAWSVGGHLG